MNYRIVFRTVGQILKVEAALLFVPLAIALFYNERTVFAFSATILLTSICASIFSFVPVKKSNMYAREGLIIVAFSWIFMSLFGALPLFLSGSIKNYLDCIFETVSGFTTTGATIIDNIDILPKSINFWRCFTHWIGGMGILVFVLALLPGAESNSMHILRAEVPGPTIGKLVAKTKVTARILYAMYIVLTFTEALLLKIGGNTLYDSLIISFSTAGTGGFSAYNASIAAYNSLYTEVICIVFMLIFSLNFNLFYLILVKQAKRALRSEELIVFFGIVLVAICAITANVYPVYHSVSESIRNSAFCVSSIISTTGFTTIDISELPYFSQHILLLLMFFGGCAGSTAGGLKTSRVIILIKSGFRSIKKTLSPNTVQTVKLDGESVREETVSGVNVFFAIYAAVFALSFLIVSINGKNTAIGLSSVASCLNNVGPMLGGYSTYSSFSYLSKVVFILDMLIGRLEIYPILVLFMRSTWKKIR